MTVKEFINNFVEPNTLMRLHYKIKGGHKEILSPQMEWKIKHSKYSDNEVIGVTDILYSRSHYCEAVNLVIKRL